jgi:hypothetical protein
MTSFLVFCCFQVEALLTGKAGTSIILGLYTDQVRGEKNTSGYSTRAYPCALVLVLILVLFI